MPQSTTQHKNLVDPKQSVGLTLMAALGPSTMPVNIFRRKAPPPEDVSQYFWSDLVQKS